MLPSELKESSFNRYTPEAREAALQYLSLLRRLPIGIAPMLLAQIKETAWLFPAEKQQLFAMLERLQRFDEKSFSAIVAPFVSLRLPESVASVDWVNHPEQFARLLTTELWVQHSRNAYQDAAGAFFKTANASIQSNATLPRVVIVVLGDDLAVDGTNPFKMLKQQGTFFEHVDGKDGNSAIQSWINARVAACPEEFAHWYIDGHAIDGSFLDVKKLCCTSFAGVQGTSKWITRERQRFLTGQTEERVSPKDLEMFLASLENAPMQASVRDPRIERFERKLLLSAAGTQVFSTTYVQWAAREALRRAQPATLTVHFGARQTAAPMDVLLNSDPETRPADPVGSLLDAEMGSYYTWINATRLPASENLRFLAWHPRRQIAVAVSPSFPRDTVSQIPVRLQRIVQLLSA